MSKLRIGLIGFGAWARSAYLPAIEYDGRGAVTAVTASTEKTRQQAREILGENVAVFGSYEELLHQAEIDAVMIAVPNHIHEAALTAAIESGIAVFYEPPIAVTRIRIPTMINRLIAAPQVTFAHLELCNHPGIMRSVQLIKDKVIGLLHNVTITLHADWGDSDNSDLCLLNHMSSWYVGVLNKIIEDIPERVLLLDGYGGSNRMQTISTGIYDYNGIWGIIKANVNSLEGVSITIEVVGSEGDIHIDYFKGSLCYRSRQHSEWVVEDCSPLKPYADWPGVRETISLFLDAVISGVSSQGNADDVAQLHLIGMAADESKDTGNWATVKKI